MLSPHGLRALLDVSGSIFSFASTTFYILAKPQAWPIGIIACLINFTLYLRLGLYADTALESIYLLSQFYGWYYWLHGGTNQQSKPITHLSKLHGIILGCLSVLFIIVIESVLRFQTNDSAPFWDATTMILSLAAQWLTCRKIIETWILWLVVDSMYVGLYIYKQIPAHSLLLCIYLVMAMIGYWSWWRKLKSGSH